jgi:hypothetical protein
MTKSKKAPAIPQKLSADRDSAIQVELYKSQYVYVKELSELKGKK